jgi:hypothetical protein
MIEVKTTSGFVARLEEDALDDYELLELLAEADSGKIGSLFAAVNLLLGQEQTEALKNHLRREGGRVPASKMMEEIREIMTLVPGGKNF